jgi:hypothetical protein
MDEQKVVTPSAAQNQTPVANTNCGCGKKSKKNKKAAM